MPETHADQIDRLAKYILDHDLMPEGFEGGTVDCAIHLLRPVVARANEPAPEPSPMDFGRALEALRAGKRVRRAGWNGKGMWLALTEGSHIDGAQARNGAAKLRAAEAGYPSNPCILTIGAHIDMRAADGTLVIGWLASQTDMLANDWEVV